MEPRLIERECGGWLAVTGPDDHPKIGVTAPSQGEARAAFAQADRAWQTLIEAARRSAGDGVKPPRYAALTEDPSGEGVRTQYVPTEDAS